MPTKRRIWMVVADAGQARIFFTATGSQGTISELADEGLTNEELHRHSRDVGTDRPGRSVDSVGHARHSEDAGVDLHRGEKERFARRLAAHIEDRARQDSFDTLLIVASPRTLGALRPALGPETLKRLIREIDKDLTKLPFAELAAKLRAAIPPSSALTVRAAS